MTRWILAASSSLEPPTGAFWKLLNTLNHQKTPVGCWYMVSLLPLLRRPSTEDPPFWAIGGRSCSKNICALAWEEIEGLWKPVFVFLIIQLQKTDGFISIFVFFLFLLDASLLFFWYKSFFSPSSINGAFKISVEKHRHQDAQRPHPAPSSEDQDGSGRVAPFEVGALLLAPRRGWLFVISLEYSVKQRKKNGLERQKRIIFWGFKKGGIFWRFKKGGGGNRKCWSLAKKRKNCGAEKEWGLLLEVLSQTVLPFSGFGFLPGGCFCCFYFWED